MTDGLEEIGLPPLGHNKPPEPTALDRVTELVANCNRWLAERPIIVDAEQAGAAQRFTLQLRTLRDDLGNDLRRERRPHDDAVEAIKNRYRDPQELVALALDAMEKKNRDWLKREQDRLDAERIERERLADAAIVEAAEAARAADKPGATVDDMLAAARKEEAAAAAVEHAQRTPTRARTRDDYAPRAMSLHSNWKARVVDEPQALKHYAKHPAIRTAALAAIVKVATKLSQLSKGSPAAQPPGVEFWNDERAR